MYTLLADRLHEAEHRRDRPALIARHVRTALECIVGLARALDRPGRLFCAIGVWFRAMCLVGMHGALLAGRTGSQWRINK